MTIKEEVLEEIRPEDLYTMERQLAYEEGSLKTVLEKAINRTTQKTLEKVEKVIRKIMCNINEMNIISSWLELRKEIERIKEAEK